MEKNTSYLPRFNEPLKEIAKNNDLGLDDVKDIVDEFFMAFKESIEDPRMPTIKLSPLGTWKPTVKRLKWHLNITFSNLRQERISREKALRKVKHVWPVYRRLLEEKAGVNTWKKWRDKYKNNDSKEESKKSKVEGKSSKRNNAGD